MFQVVPEPEFAAWYESLPEPLAEEVTTAIELLANSGDGLAAERPLSRLLLWFDGTSPADAVGSSQPGAARTPDWLELPAAQARSYLMWHHEALQCLESAAFGERLAQLEPTRAAQALRQVERLKRQLRSARLASHWSPWLSRSASRQAFDASAIHSAFSELLGSVGLEPELALGSVNGVRELRIDTVEPPLRVLLGLDFASKRIIALLGEPLERRYYGDSVRRAEQRFRQCCEGTPKGASATP